MQGTLLLAAVHPDNTPHGYNLTFAFPMLMFIIVAGALFLRFRSPHQVPGHVALQSSRWAATGGAAGATAAAATTATPERAAGAAEDPDAAATTEEGTAGPADDSTEGGE